MQAPVFSIAGKKAEQKPCPVTQMFMDLTRKSRERAIKKYESTKLKKTKHA